DLEELGYLEKIEPHMLTVGICDRCHTVVEPLMSWQWFVSMQSLEKPAIEAVREDGVKFVPDRFERVYLNWMENIRDWCISRQLWWGHHIAICRCESTHVACQVEDPARCPKCGQAVVQEEDVLDTWFSSGLAPHADL